MTYLISKQIEFDAGHRVPLHDSKCKNPHGHRYRVQVTIEGELITEGPQTGMVKDFGHLKQDMMELIHDRYDHGFIIHSEDVAMQVLISAFDSFKIIVEDFVPTAECLAKKCWDLLKETGRYNNLREVAVWETPTSVAYYHG